MPNYNLIDPSVQYDFHVSRKKVQVFGGGFANGKTTALAIKALKLAKDYPGSNGLLARETYPKLNDTLRRVFMHWCPTSWIARKPTQDDNTCYLKNGSAINFRYLSQRGRSKDDGSSTSNLLSATYDWIGVDQIEDPGIIYKDFLDLLGRLRGDAVYQGEEEDDTMPLTGPRWLMVTANPTHNWFYKLIVKPYLLWLKTGQFSKDLLIDGDTKLPLLEVYESDTYANSSNLAADYIKTLESTYKGQQRDRYLLGKWVAFEGLVHPDFDPIIHTMTREFAENYLDFCLQQYVQVQGLEGYDFGITSPTCYLLAFVDHIGRVIVLDGFYEPNYSYDLHPQRIRDIRARYAGKLKYKSRIWADPAIFRKAVIAGRKETGSTVAKLLEDLGIYMKPANNDIMTGIPKVNSYLNGKSGIVHLTNGQDVGPLMYFVEDLEFIDTEFSSYYWKQSPTGDRIDEPMDSNDHAMNTLKYMLADLPEISKIVMPQDKLPPKWLFWHEADTDEMV